ncbi:hypothetical protein E4T52_07711 [Aureobasidium sp. EXF-3400]|nr:hypothetical protein E4T52_07711 [Aureobasidium sp. EXF-3400]
MVNYTTPGTTLCANSTHSASPHDESSSLEWFYSALYFTCSLGMLVVIVSEWCQRARKVDKNSFHVWGIRVPFLAAGLSSGLAVVSACLKHQQIESYTQSGATRSFIEVCSNPFTREFNSTIAINTFLTDCNAVQNRMNADIGGIGIRISLYISLAVAFFSSLAGHFHQEKTAVKDIGTAQLASMLSIMFALLRSYTALNFWQVMVAVMSLDITSAIVQMTLSQKDTLASRWWIVLNAISQLLVHISIGVVLGKTFPISPARQDPCQTCVRVVRWGTFDSCNQVPRNFWIYWVLRTLLVMRSCAIGLHHMHFYDFGERIARGEKSSQEVSWSSHVLRLLTFTDPTKDTTTTDFEEAEENRIWSPEAFPRMPATTLTDWVLWILPAAVAVVSLERMLILFELSNPGNIEDWGQTTTFMAVICGLVARAIYLFYAKWKRRSCLERTKTATKFDNVSTAQKIQPSTEDFVSLASKFKSFRGIQKILQPVDCVRWELPNKVWYQYVDPKEAAKELLLSVEMNDIRGLIEWAEYVPDLSTAVDNEGRTALHLALEYNNLEAIETIMRLMNPKPRSGESTATACRSLEKLLNSRDGKKRSPWEMIIPNDQHHMDPDILGAALNFASPIINSIFSLPPQYSLDIMRAWFDAAEKSHSLRQLQECIIQAFRTDSGIAVGIAYWVGSVWELYRWQYERKTAFATRLLRVFLESSARRSLVVPADVALYLAQSLQQKQVWAIESGTDIARIVASSADSLDVIELVTELVVDSDLQYPQMVEQVLMGAVSNKKIAGILAIEAMLKTWPDKVDITPKVLETLLANKSTGWGQHILRLLLAERPDQIQVTESMLMFVAQSHGLGLEVWEELLKNYQFEMTQEIFNAMVVALFDPVGSENAEDTAVFEDILGKWPQATRITRPVLLSLIPQNRLDVFELLHELRRDELERAIDSEVLIFLGRWSTKNEARHRDNRKRYIVDFLFESYPEKCKASITDPVLQAILRDGDGFLDRDEARGTAEYFRVFRNGHSDGFMFLERSRAK